MQQPAADKSSTGHDSGQVIALFSPRAHASLGAYEQLDRIEGAQARLVAVLTRWPRQLTLRLIAARDIWGRYAKYLETHLLRLEPHIRAFGYEN